MRQLDRSDWLWLLGSLAQLHRIPFDPALAEREAPPPVSDVSLAEAAGRIGLVLGQARIAAGIDQVPLPCVAWLRPGVQEGESARPGSDAITATTPAESRPVLVLRADGGRVLYLAAGSETPYTVAASEFPALFEPDVLLVKRAPEAACDADLGTAPRAFGLSWFIPEFRKHEHIWREVLIVSLVLQVLGLATPLLTQVVIDKVVVHHTMSTLVVVGLGLAIAVLFTAAFGWLRQYLVIHTGNRIDAVLGSTVLRHLLRLPLTYFQHRPTGVLVARLRGVEVIREFLAGSLVAVLLDLPFMVVLLAVMFVYSWQLTLTALALLTLLTALSLAVTPGFRARLDHSSWSGRATRVSSPSTPPASKR